MCQQLCTDIARGGGTVEAFDTGYPSLGARALLINPLLAALAALQPTVIHE